MNYHSISNLLDHGFSRGRLLHVSRVMTAIDIGVTRVLVDVAARRPRSGIMSFEQRSVAAIGAPFLRRVLSEMYATHVTWPHVDTAPEAIGLDGEVIWRGVGLVAPHTAQADQNDTCTWESPRVLLHHEHGIVTSPSLGDAALLRSECDDACLIERSETLRQLAVMSCKYAEFEQAIGGAGEWLDIVHGALPQTNTL